MSFSTIIKDLRKKRDMTQDELAEALDITSQAVSRWETGATMPDTSALTKLAYLFDVTTDYLLEVDVGKINMNITEICNRAYSMCNDVTESEIRASLEKYPQNIDLMRALMSMPFYSKHDCKSEQEKRLRRKKVDEAIKLGEYVLSHTTDYTALGEVRYLLIAYYREIGDRRKAESLIDTVEDYSAKLDMKINFTEGMSEWVSLMQESTYLHLNTLIWNLYKLSIANAYYPDTYSTEESIEILEKANRISEILMDKDTPYLYSCNPLHIAWQASRRYSELEETDKALEQLEIMKQCAAAADSFKDKKAFPMKSLIFNKYQNIKYGGNWGIDWMRDIMGDDYYNNIRKDARFQAIADELKQINK